jgi:hypothetical protein
MRLEATAIEKSPLGPDRVRLVGNVTYKDGTDQQYWFDVREPYGEYLSTTGNPWLATLLPLAVCTDEPLEINAPVDRLMYENIQELMYVWKGWYPDLPLIEISADVIESGGEPERSKVGQFFTGGVDSLFTALKHTHNFTPDAPFEVDDLISICGYDIPLANAENYAGRYERQKRFAAETGKELIDIYTNARETVIARIRHVGLQDTAMWGRVSHACGLSGLAHALEKRYRKVIISSSYSYSEFSSLAYGTSPLTDHLCSSRMLNIFHYGSGFSRAQKVLYIAPSDVALKTIQVCFHNKDEKNCGWCLKCMQTMIPLEIADALPRAATFPVDQLDLERVSRILTTDVQQPFVHELCDLAREHGKNDLAVALERSFERAEIMARQRKFKDWLTTKPIIWRFAKPLRRKIRKMQAESVVWSPNAAQREVAEGAAAQEAPAKPT